MAWLAALPMAAAAAPVERYALKPEQLALVVNDADPGSVQIAAEYQKLYQIPPQNLIHIRLPGKPARIDSGAFRFLRQGVMAQLKPDIQAMLLVWSAPYAVECNSITSAMTFGFEPGICQRTCNPSRPNPYFDSESNAPYTDHGLRPAMLLPTDAPDLARKLLAKSYQAGREGLREAGAYYLHTSDRARNTRVPFFPPAANLPQKKLRIKNLRSDALEGVSDVMIYQTGAPHVQKLETLHFLPGALADHLTSFGGDLQGKSQMTVLRWLEAGATASYGTVSEPCAHPQKFPHPTVLLKHYLAGASALEAYLKSIAWPAQGLLVGDPLAAPYATR
ncbi:TIGR03790 family protein [Massilia sp. W12]|uniref:TIGR03790 family protein n=1 Tax=Massilia sp. W12 TaxID=3126507 RepID=UPI0030D12C4D